VLAIVFTVAWLMNLLRKKKNIVREICDANKEMFIILLLSSFTVFIVLVGVAVRWGGTVAKGNMYGYKGFSYERYYIAFAWPGALSIILLWRKIKDYNLKTIRWIAGGLTLIISVVFIMYLFPHLQMIREQGGYNAFVYMSYFENVGKMGERARYLFLTIALMLIFVALLLLKNRRYMIVYITLIMGLTLFIKTQGFNISIPSIRCSYFQASYACIKDVEDDIILPEVLYYYGHKPYSCQFMLNRYTIDDRWVDETVDDAIIFSRKAPEVIMEEIELENNNYYYTQLGNEEYLYIKGEEYSREFSENGYIMNRMENS
jgi:hypothetical protein